MADEQNRDQESGRYAEAHPDRPNSGEAPNEQEVTEEALRAAEIKYGGGRGAAAQGPVRTVDAGDLALTGGDLENRLGELDEEIDNEQDPVRRAHKAAERDQVANRVYALQAEQAAAESDATVDDPGDARGQRTEASREEGRTRRLSDEGEDKGQFNEVGANAGVERGAQGNRGGETRGQERAAQVKERNKGKSGS